MDLPIKFKYFTLQRGQVLTTRADEKSFEGYVLVDENGIQIAGGTSLGGMIAHGQSADITMEMATQWVERKLESMEHINGIDIDAQPESPSVGLAIPSHLLPPERQH